MTKLELNVKWIRSGTIAFTLRAGEANASGNVVMIPQPVRGRNERYYRHVDGDET